MGSTFLLVLFWLLFLSLLVNAADLYKALELSSSASEQDIRKAYKRLSRKYHPDKNKDPGSEEKFVEIAHAYEILSDPQKKQIYDRHGEASVLNEVICRLQEGLKANEGGQHYANPFDLFSNFFGGGHPANQQRRGPNSVSDMEVSLSDLYTGANIDFMVKKRILCDHCRGTGAASTSDVHTCPVCGGSGVQVIRQQIMPGMYSQAQVTCGSCGGQGKTIGRKCPHCSGAKVLDHTQHYTLEVPKGASEGHEVVFEGEGDESPDWEAGDIVIRVRSRRDKGGWRRKESGLYWKETIGVEEALLGFERNLTHLDGHIVQLKRHGVTQPGFVQTIKGEGMPIYEQEGAFGDLYVEYNVILPNEIGPDMKRRA
ncbi:DnaJ-domain-containing protein [Laetiporus sulphureus 93-53]|uniref:DnaJ-domain-containing protein n=1 Tax=Laetiporus sulphureus 93-53 TaxID=1314785 RepID=A0A165BDN2_9APHY|nr:DnaJ-domain-containing protein [Laetiporus sulphureus 93-53]KZT00814.1 DnaJ-domain-containing protein [Laetiporus sulphureus 93-53]